MRAAAASELAITTGIIFEPGGGSYAHRTRACMRARIHGLANFFKFQLRTVHTRYRVLTHQVFHFCL